MIEVRELTKWYGSFQAVAGVTFDVAEGEVVGFLGPNGAGKSTTMKMLTTYLPPTSGTAKIAGYDIFLHSEKAREQLGYLPENCPLYTEMRVVEYLEFRGRLRKLAKAERKKRIGEVLEKCWLTNVERKPIGQLSKGYRQRVGLADALLHDPKVLILDEPTVGLDPTQILETRKLIRGLGKVGGGKHTVMLSTHILPEVEAVCSRVIVIAGGKKVAEGTLDELRTSRRGTGHVVVETKADAGVAVPVLTRIQGVRDVKVIGNRDGFVTFAVNPVTGRDVREEIARTVVGQGWPLREIRMETESLEQFFVKVTAEQASSQSSQSSERGAA